MLLPSNRQPSKFSLSTSSFATVNHLPPEILSEIFLWLHPEINEEDPANRDRLHLLRVCKQWQYVALGTPRLWSFLSLVLDEEVSQHSREVDTWLKRSGTCTFTLEIMDTEASQRTHGRTIMEALLPHMPRCRRLHAYMRTQFFNMMFTSSRAAGMEQLEYLDLKVQEGPSDWILMDFSAYPRLTDLFLQFNSEIATIQCRGEGTRLQSIFLTDPRQLLPLMRYCPSLRDCILHLDNEDFYWNDADTSTLEHPHTQKLTVIATDMASLTKGFSVLKRLTLPALRALEIQKDDLFMLEELYGEHTGPLIRSFLQRTCPSLTELFLDGDFIDATSLVMSLAVVPTLTTLLIRGYTPGREFWNALTMRRDVGGDSDGLPNNVCPQLKDLTITDVTEYDGDLISDIADMILSRCADEGHSTSFHKPLNRLSLACVLDLEEELLKNPGIMTCIEAGLEILIKKIDITDTKASG